MLTPDQLIAAHKANIETLFGLTNKAFEGVEKLVELNLQVAKAAIGEAAEVAEANFQAVTSTAVKATQAATRGKRATAAA